MKISFKIKLVIACSVVLMNITTAASQIADTSFFLITCGPGTETYSIYGHSALRVVTGQEDIVYNWGVFDFDTPNFAWKFAKGRLNYMLAYEPFERFLRSYFYEERFVIIQKINLEPGEKRRMLELINLNLRPENVKYRYDFFYDDCSTRIRDIIERSASENLIYSAGANDSINPTFRQMLDKYQVNKPWLDFGVDMLIGVTGDKAADVRDRMFLPIDMMEGLSNTCINHNGQNTPLLGPQEMVLDFNPPLAKDKLPGPFIVFSGLFLVILFMSFYIRKTIYLNIMDGFIFIVFSIIAVLLIFFNFFTEHDQMRMNLNIIWVNPLLILCLFSLLLNRKDKILFRSVFSITAIFIVLHLALPQEFNISNYPLMLIILLRSSARSGFSWNPITVRKDNKLV